MMGNNREIRAQGHRTKYKGANGVVLQTNKFLFIANHSDTLHVIEVLTVKL